jgi:subtilisin family serine protease
MKTFLLLCLLSSVAFGKEPCKPITIAVIDTGFGYNGLGNGAKLCYAGHVDFTDSKRFSYYGEPNLIPTDTNGHGTNIVGIIDSYARKSKKDYCIMILKYYSSTQTGSQNLKAGTEAIKFADEMGADFINYSGGGPEFDEKEYLTIKRFLDRGGRFVAAAGNDAKNIDVRGNEYYPAKYDKRIVIVGNAKKHPPEHVFVGNLTENEVRSKSSNYGKSVNRWEVGEDVWAYGLVYSGTSQATAVATGKLVSETHRQCDIGF